MYVITFYFCRDYRVYMIGSQRKFIAQQKAAIENCLNLCTTYFRLDIQQNKNICK